MNRFGSATLVAGRRRACSERERCLRGTRETGLTPAVVAKLAQPGAPSPLASDRIYFVMTDRYANGDPSNDLGGHSGSVDQTGYDPASTAWWHGGDFKGLTGACTTGDGLARLKALGFNADLGLSAGHEPDRGRQHRAATTATGAPTS